MLVKQDEDEDEGVLLFSKLDSYGPAKNRNYLPDPMMILDLIKENLSQPTIATEGQEGETKIKKEAKKEEKKDDDDDDEKASGKAEEEKEEKKPKRIAKRRAKMMN